MIRVILIEDHHLIRQGIRLILEQADDIEVVAEAANGQDGVDLARRLAPDVIITDLSMPRLSGIQVAEQIRGLGLSTRVIILSAHSDHVLVQQALQHSVKGYLLKTSLTDELLQAVRTVCRGETFLCARLARQLRTGHPAARAAAGAAGPFARLSPREREVLKLVAEGYTNRAVATALHLSIKTVEKHRASLMAKLDVHDLPGLIRLAVKHGLVFVEE
jgi:DNA-binding NarL/FixJ family response regulator